MFNILKKAGKACGYLGGGLTLVTFVQGTQQNKLNKRLLNELNKRNEMQESLITKYESAAKTELDYTKVSSKVSEINESTEAAIKESTKIRDISQKLQDPNLNSSQTEMTKTDLDYHSTSLQEKISAGNKQFEELNKMLQDIFSSKKDFFDSNIFENFQNYLNTLPLEKIGALGHILISIAILFSLLSIIFIFYGEFLIKYFKLEEKYPRIVRFIQIRRKFQQYYFTLNIIAIVLSLLLVIYVNFIIFIS